MTLVLVTRPQEDAVQLTSELKQAGFETLLEPLLKIKFDDKAMIDLGNVQGLLFTSANGVRAFTRLNGTRTLPAYCVGDSTAHAARSLGFLTVHSANGNVDKLSELVRIRCNPSGGYLYHAAASQLAGDLKNLLTIQGFKYRRGILYEAMYAETLTDHTIKSIVAKKVNAVLLFSPRTAHEFIKNFKKANLLNNAKDLSLFCLSSNVENQVNLIGWKSVVTANIPTQQALLAILKEKMG